VDAGHELRTDGDPPGLAGLGFGLVTAPLSTAVIDAAGETQRGVTSGLVVILRLVGMSAGLSLLTAWGLAL
jgi:hypothetical protein